MRFLADGPSIPDELLLARDQGRVIFFCGAGVSRARANLPDFFGLARSVVSKLGVDQNSPAYKLIREAQEIDRRVGISGVISADRVFGLLERDFASRDIEEAVAAALKPPSECDLTVHRILLDLATTPEGAVQLVTTNFDRLFDDCGRGLHAWQPPRLPDPLRPNEINGIVYLHGRSTPTYTGASAKLSIECLPVFDRTLRKLIGVLRESPNEGYSGIRRGSQEPDWTMEAINSPTGKIAEALFNDPRKDNLNRNQGFPSEWLAHAEALLALSDDLRRHTLVILFHNLNWFFAVDPKWTEQHLLPALQGNDTDDRDAAWSGFLWGARTPDRELYMRLKNDMLEFAANPLPSRRSYGEIIAGMILAGWGTVDDATGERCISNDEMRNLLLTVDDEFRSRVLWQAQRWSGEENENSHERWQGQLSELLQIWPRQISARSPSTSARLCELAFSSGDQFPTIAALVLPLLSGIERDHLMLPELRRSGDNIVDRYPEQALALLHAVLPDNALAWPYGIEGILQRIGEVDSTLNTDDRLISLKRRWDAR